MQLPQDTSADSSLVAANLNDSFLEKPSPSTDCDWRADILWAPRPRARTRLNDSGFFEEDNKITNPDASYTDKEESASDNDGVEDWASVSTYSIEIFSYLLELEQKFRLPKNFLDNQVEVTNQSRAVLVDWLIQVHEYYNFPQDCLYLVIGLVDRYMSQQIVPLTEFQLLGMACLLVACKYDDRFVPPLRELVTMADEAFSDKDLNNMEKRLLHSITFDLSQPLPTHFLRRIARAAGKDVECYVVAKFLMEVAMLDSVMVTFKPSLIAASSFSLASSFVWEEGKLLENVPGSGYELNEMRPCLVRMAGVLRSLHELGCKGITQKYNKLGLSPSIVEHFTSHPTVTELLTKEEKSD